MIKTFFQAITLLLITGSANAQVAIGNPVPAASAQLDVSSTTKGFLPPRMRYAQRIAIQNPAAGLMIYCTNCGLNGQWQGFNGVAWTDIGGDTARVAYVPPIGLRYMGGKVAYVLKPGDPGYDANEPHGLIADTTDLSIGVEWGCSGIAIIGADGIALGTGNQNTVDIVAGCATAGIPAKLCSNLVVNGFSDWYLPSKDEMSKIYLSRTAIGGFDLNFYWTSSEINSANAWAIDFFSGSATNVPKSFSGLVRAVRSF